MEERKIRMGMVGGGIGAFIGQVHRIAAGMDSKIELVCGAFSSDPKRSKDSGLALGLPTNRVYDNFSIMMQAEAELPENQRMELVSIVTPNHVHFAPAMEALDKGYHVVCDKPLCFNLEQAYALKEKVKSSGKIFALTHNYTGYPMVKQAREMVKQGDIGEVRKVMVEYPQGWLSTLLEASGQKQASWRTDPSKSGIAGALGDIGTHAENLAEYITGLKIKSLCADLNIMVSGRKLDDDCNVLLRFENGANGILMASQIATGEENNLAIKIYGTKASLEWRQMQPNSLTVRSNEKPTQILRTAGAGLYEIAEKAHRLPAGHPEGYLEAFANIYKEVADCILGLKNGRAINDYDFPKIDDGLRGMEFIYKVVESSSSDQKWLDL